MASCFALNCKASSGHLKYIVKAYSQQCTVPRNVLRFHILLLYMCSFIECNMLKLTYFSVIV